MYQPRVLVIGKNGQVGWELCRTLATMAEVIAVDYPEIDLTNEDSIRTCVRDTRADVVINAAAYTAVDKAEAEIEKARLINAVAPGILAEETSRRGAWLVHYSTDYVFDGTKETPYVEDDSPEPLSAYGKTKAEGDAAVVAEADNFLVFRLCWVYGARGQNFMRTIMRLASEREQLRVVADQTGSPTWSRMIASATTFAVRQVLREANRSKFTGVYHLAASGQTSWQGFAQAIVDNMPAETRKCSVVQPIGTADYPLPATRPANSVLNCFKLQQVFGLKLPDWRLSLGHVMEKP